MQSSSVARHSDQAGRISPMDMGNLRVEEHGMPMHVAALAVLDGAPLLREGGGLRLTDIRTRVEQRIRAVDRLHQLLVWPDGAHRRPVWGAAAHFDIADHVLASSVPPPGDEEALLRLCAELNEPPLDRRRPLWELWLLPGLSDDRVALLLRLHHVVADGTAALDLLSSILDPAPDLPESPGSGPVLGRAPEQWGLGGLAVRARQLWDLTRLGRAPALSWNRPVGPDRVHLLARADLARAKAAAHARGGKVNDVVLAAVAEGAHRLLESRDEPVPGGDLHVSVAASIRRPGETGGNRVGVRLVAVPVGDAEPDARLRTVAARTAAQRDEPPLQPSGLLLQRWMVRVMKRQRMTNLILSNLPGPTAPLSFAGAAVRELFQLSPLQGNCTIGVGVLSYAGQLNIDIVADPLVVPDVGVFAAGVTGALEQLGAVGRLVHDR